MVQADLFLTSEELGRALAAFTVGMIAGCVLLTVVTALAGARWGLTLGFAGAALAAVVSGLVANVTGLMATRFALGFFTAALIPAIVQHVGECFTRPLRPLAIGLILASYQAVAIITPFLVPFLAERIGWRPVVAATGVPTLVAAVLCLVFAILVKEPPVQPVSGGLSAAGLVSAGTLALGLGLAMPVVHLCTTWLPVYLQESLSLSFSSSSKMGLCTTAGALGGALLAGVIACILTYVGVRPAKTRAALLTACGCVLPLVAVVGLLKMPFAVVLLGFLVMAGYYGVVTLLYWAVADTLPVRGIGIAVAVGSLMMIPGSWIIGTLRAQVGFEAVFLLAGFLGAAAWLVVALPAWFIRQEAWPLLNKPSAT
jgi:sugar phosphate permease